MQNPLIYHNNKKVNSPAALGSKCLMRSFGSFWPKGNQSVTNRESTRTGNNLAWWVFFSFFLSKSWINLIILDTDWVSTQIFSLLWNQLFSSVSSLQFQSSVLNSSVVQSDIPNVVLEGLRPGTGYVVQVRARTVAGYGSYSKEMLFQTLTDGKSLSDWLKCAEAWAELL